MGDSKYSGNANGDRFTKLEGAEYDRVNDLLRQHTTREWAIARVCQDFRTETGVEMTAAGKHLPEIVPFMDEPYSPQSVNSAKTRFDEKVQGAATTMLYGALCGVYTSEELDDILYKATEAAKYLIELEGGRVDVETEIEVEEQLAECMREVRETSLEVRDELEAEDGDDGA